MTRIRQLSPVVVSQIAAGEVIERPASVLKELLENSIDAGATRLDIELEQGGVERLCVADDGCGIHADDLTLAFSSHATSKLRDADDLFRIGTLGFRGEALASIGGVARVSLQSRPRDAECGAELRCEGGALSDARPWSGAFGTRIEVRHLFFNTPVRKKFLRAASTEVGHATEVVTRLALAYPTLHVTLRHNGRLVHEIPASMGLVDRICHFFGGDLRPMLLEVRSEAGPAELWGYVADPACDRGSARTQYLWLNGRWIRDRSLSHALQDAYRGLLMTGRFAVGFLFIQLPPDQVDVNVHPTKAEVRFRDPSAVYHLVRTSVNKRLRQASLVPTLEVPIQPTPAGAGAVPIEVPLPPMPASTPLPWERAAPPPVADVPLPDPPVIAPTPVSPPAAPLPPRRPGEPRLADLPLKAIQIHDSYLVVETNEGMLVIDQHALHERILFEQLQRRIRAGTLERQRLLIPEPIDLPTDQAGLVLDHAEALADLGIEVSDFGGGTVLLSSYPTLLGRSSPGVIFQGVVDRLLAKERAPSREQLLNDLLATMACKAAVKAGDRMSPEEVAALMAQRQLADDSHHCPHGRPTSLVFTRQELEKQFRRI